MEGPLSLKIYTIATIILVFGVPGVVGGYLAWERSRNVVFWFLVSMIPPIPHIVLGFLKPLKVVEGRSRACPHCGRIVLWKAMTCPQCEGALEKGKALFLKQKA